MQKTVLSALLILAALASQPLQAATHSEQMRVTVEVIARTILTIDQEPAAVAITATDVARGYVDVPGAIAFHVRSNSRRGYTVQFQPVAKPFTRASVSWGTSTASFGSGGSWIAQPYVKGTAAGSMDVRLSLAPEAEPGMYAWPVSMNADSQ